MIETKQGDLVSPSDPPLRGPEQEAAAANPPRSVAHRDNWKASAGGRRPASKAVRTLWGVGFDSSVFRSFVRASVFDADGQAVSDRRKGRAASRPRSGASHCKFREPGAAVVLLHGSGGIGMNVDI